MGICGGVCVVIQAMVVSENGWGASYKILGNLEGCKHDSDHLQMIRNILKPFIPTNILDSQMGRLGKGVWREF